MQLTLAESALLILEDVKKPAGKEVNT